MPQHTSTTPPPGRSPSGRSPSRSSGPATINEFNAWLKQQPWYQDFIRRAGFEGRPVKLSRGQQSQLESIMRANGVPLGEGVHIDNAGNLNERNRLVRNAAIATAAAVGGYFAAPYLPYLLNPGWSGVASPSLTGTGVAAGGTTAATTAAGSALPALTSLTGAPIIGAGATGGTGLSVGSGLASALGGSGFAATGGLVPLTTGAGLTGSVAAPGMFSRLASTLRNPRVLEGAGRILTRTGENLTAGREAEINNRLTYDQLALVASQQARQRQRDATRANLLATGVQQATGLDAVASQRAPYLSAIRPPSDDERTQADITRELMQRQLARGFEPDITPYSDLPTRPSMFERIATYAGPALDIWGQTRGRR